VHYHLTPLGQAYVATGTPDDVLFSQVLRVWPPYAQTRKAILEHGVASESAAVANYFKAQYAPYEPYAKCLFNPKKCDGLVKWHERFG